MFRVDISLDDIPWHRVINSKGEISYSHLRQGDDYLQKHLLQKEGIEFDKQGKINLAQYQWKPNLFSI